MKMTTKLSAAVLASGLLVAASAMAATTPRLVADSATLTKAVGANVTVSNVLSNDSITGSTGNVYLGSKPQWGTATCTTAGSCTYFVGSNSTGKTSDRFTYIYSFSYTDAKGRTITGKASAAVNITLVSTAASP